MNWLYVPIRQKRLLVDRQPSGTYLFQDLPVLDAVRNLRNHAISCLDLRICQPHQKGHQQIEHVANLAGDEGNHEKLEFYIIAG